MGACFHIKLFQYLFMHFGEFFKGHLRMPLHLWSTPLKSDEYRTPYLSALGVLENTQ